MKKIIITFLASAMLLCVTGVNAQTVVKGARVPQLTTAERNTISSIDAVNAQGQVVYNTDTDCKEYWDGTKWICVKDGSLTPRWFYMPSIPIDVSAAVADKTVNLHSEYVAQMGNTAAAFAKNPGAPATIDNIIGAGKVYAAGELDYYVIGYDTSVFSSVSVTDAGILSYTITSAALANVSDATYMNIIFVVK
ncbi:MAG: hypothetical protein LBN27_06405 [Prevotellaceae bacterium]|jgi:hypothetical protein|nr:hypothetical protein [Prevotellaceae bacterium]